MFTVIFIKEKAEREHSLTNEFWQTLKFSAQMLMMVDDVDDDDDDDW